MIGNTPRIGHNNPPPDTCATADDFRASIDELLEEARNWLDDKGVQSQADADGVSKLLEELRRTSKDADKARAAEKKPHDDAAKAVQAKWKPIIDKADLAAKVCKQALTPFLTKLADEKRAREEEARRQAEAAEIAAQQAFAQTGPSDLEAREEAERLAKAAKDAEAEFKRTAKEKTHAKGGSRAIGLRTSYVAEIENANDFAKWAWVNCRADMDAFLADLAQRLVRNGQRGMPGVNVVPKQEAA